MRIEFVLYKGKNVWVNELKECHDRSLTFSQRLEACLFDFCRSYDVGMPLWMSTNTKEFAAFHQTTFTAEHFMEKTPFDYLLLRFLDD